MRRGENVPLPRARFRVRTHVRVLLAALCLSVSLSPAAAQSSDITGTVRDSLNNETLPNAVVSLVGESFRTLTDEFGRFTLVNVVRASTPCGSSFSATRRSRWRSPVPKPRRS